MVTLKGLFPKQANFFRIFEQLADTAIQGANLLEELLESPAERSHLVEKISEIENQADHIVHEAIAKLHETFITPMDRLNIHQLLLRVDEMVDLIYAAGERIRVYGIKKILPETLELARLTKATVHKTQGLMYQLENLKEPEEIFFHCVEINRLENASDSMMRKACGRLMELDIDFREFFRQKEMIEVLESIGDRAEDVAHLVEAIVLDHA